MPSIITLPASIPYLEPHGTNWAIFMMRFRDAMKLTHRWMYFTGQKKCPEPQDKDNPTDGEIEAAEKWEYEDSVASYLLSQRLPDSAVMRLSSCSTTQEQWEMVTKEYQAKSAYAQADLHQSFLEMRCAKGGDVREFLANLCYKREELVAAGVHVTDKEYERTILRGIPNELATFASHILSSALIIHGATSIDLDDLIHQICEEAERLKSRCTRGKSGQGGREATTEEVFAAKESTGRRRRRGKCHDCGKEGHWARECCTPKREGNATAPAAQASLGATAPPKTQYGGETHTVLEIDIAEELWMAEEEVVAHTQMVDVEPDLTWGHIEDRVADAHAQLVGAEPDPLLGERDSLEDNAHAHLESVEPEILTCTEDDLLNEVEEVEEDGTTELIAEEKDPHDDLQGLGVSHLTTLEGTNAPTLLLSQSKHPSLPLRTESPPRSPVIRTGTQTTRESRPSVNTDPLPLDTPPLNGAAEPHRTVPGQIQAPTQGETLLESSRGKKLRCATRQDSQPSAHALEGKTPLGIAHRRPPDPADPYTPGSIVSEQALIGPKALVHPCQAWRPVLDESAGAHIDPWPDPGIIHADPDVYFEASALLEGEQNFILPIADSEQAVTLKTISFSSLPRVLPPPDTLERDWKPGKGVEHAQRNVARLRLPDLVTKDSDKAGGVWWESALAILGCPQLALAVEMGNIEAPNRCTVEAKRKAEWPPRGQATEHKRGPDRPPRKVPYKSDPNVLNGTGACKPKGELDVLKSAAPGHLEVKTWHMEGGPSGKGLADPERPEFEATEPRSWASLPAEKEDTSYKNEVNVAGIDYNDDHAPLFPFSIALGHSCSGCPFRVRLQGRRHHRHRWRDSWRDKARRCNATSHASPSHKSHAPRACVTNRSQTIDAFISAPINTRLHFAAVPDYVQNEGEC